LRHGKLYGLGVGPGGGGLITEKGKAVLAATDVLCLPVSKAERESVALAAARPYLRENIRIEELLFPMSRDEGVLSLHHEKAARKVASLLSEFGTVTFITIGDPSLYSTFAYLLLHLRKLDPDLSVEIIPGVTSFSAAAALLQLPLVEKNERLAVVPLPVSEEELAVIAGSFDTVVFLKVSAAFDETLDMLKRAGLDEEVYLVSRCGSKEEYWTDDPFALRGSNIDYLSLLIAKRRRGT
jgi:precorrin-2/cobalt-factor-2 C20-methyltransferase